MYVFFLQPAKKQIVGKRMHMTQARKEMSMMYGGNRERHERFSDAPKPVKAGDELDVTIEATAARGDGIAKKDGFVIFVSGAKAGERVHVRISEVKQRYAVGQIMGAAAAQEEAPAPAEEPQEPAE